ncbi:FadR/GntR family transcriptional regulator [Peribacillus kribbensis]|uniref:FadR/GntR family transcriptional regulator n=1 Tax=Peribacillus kribbensis TaxID=356658 RepID=UPI0003FA6F67|nr:FCD domain-containing protein [Peribacillus kribbensis]
MDLKKTRRLSLVEQVTRQIESLIQDRHWPVGYRLPAEPKLVEELGVSRNTLREAIRALVHSGLLITRPGDGTYVVSASALGAALDRRLRQSNLLETLEVRHALERETAALAAARRTDSELVQIQMHFAECQEAVQRKDYDFYQKADLRLHESIVEAAHNPLFMELYERVGQFVQLSIGAMIFDHLPVPHQELVEAISRKDSAGAAAAVDEYIEHFKQRVKAASEE